jgi:hypothetical protein
MDLTKLLSNISLTTFIAIVMNIEEEIKGDITIRPFTTSLSSPLDGAPGSNNDSLKENQTSGSQG